MAMKLAAAAVVLSLLVVAEVAGRQQWSESASAVFCFRSLRTSLAAATTTLDKYRQM